jgi:hypothetical protein
MTQMATHQQIGATTPTPARAGGSGPPPNSTAMTAAGINLLIGIWLFVSYWILDYSPADPGWNALVFGAAIALLALLRLTGMSLSWIFSVVNIAIGLWLGISAFTIADSDVAMTNFVVCGAAVFVLAIFAAAVRSPRML